MSNSVLETIILDARKKERATKELEAREEVARTELTSLKTEAARIHESNPERMMKLQGTDESRKTLIHINDPLLHRLAKSDVILLDKLEGEMQRLQSRVQFLLESKIKLIEVVKKKQELQSKLENLGLDQKASLEASGAVIAILSSSVLSQAMGEPNAAKSLPCYFTSSRMGTVVLRGRGV